MSVRAAIEHSGIPTRRSHKEDSISKANLRSMARFSDLANAHGVEGLVDVHHADFIGESDALPASLVGGTGRRFDVRLCHVDQWKDGKIR
jgi:hypothetical protein